MIGFWEGSGIDWTICKQTAPRFRHSDANTSLLNFVHWILFLTPNWQCQSTERRLYTASDGATVQDYQSVKEKWRQRQESSLHYRKLQRSRFILNMFTIFKNAFLNYHISSATATDDTARRQNSSVIYSMRMVASNIFLKLVMFCFYWFLHHSWRLLVSK